jgi:hypothetical protein
MCRNIRNFDPQTRRIWTCGNLCLAAGLTLTLFAGSLSHYHPDLYSALRGFLLGLAIVFLFWSTRRMRNRGSRA